MMMYMQKYLVWDIVHVLRVMEKLRYYCKDYVQEFMAESVSFLLQNEPLEQLIKGVRKVMIEVAKKPVDRMSGVSALLWYAMRGTASKLHSKAEHILRLLVDNQYFPLAISMADLMLVNSKFTASAFANTFKHLDARGVKPSVLYPAVDVDQFKEPHTFKMNFLSINRFEKKKTIELAKSAFAMLRSLDDDGFHMAASLTIAGGFDKRLRENVEYLDELKTLAEREGVSHQVKFVTSCSTTERNILLSECLCALYTPKDEHFGIVPLEAMAAQKPVIACNSGGPVESIKNGEKCFLCNPTPQEFSLAMSKFLKDPEMAKKMGEEALKHVIGSFSTKIFGQCLNSVLVVIARLKRE